MILLAAVVEIAALPVYDLASEHLRPEEYSRLVSLPHYSRWISQEAYKELVFKEIAAHKDKQQYPAKENVK